MSRPVDLIAFDADDTLWHSESLFHLTQQRFAELIGTHMDADRLHDVMIATERRNLRLYGYGVKGFTLSLIETALDVTHGTVPPTVISEILMLGRALLDHPIEPLDGVVETLEALSGRVPMIVITKGDLLHQEQKVAASGLGRFFHAVEIVSEKDAETYRRLFRRHGHDPSRAAMVGNSPKSDILPALAAGAWGLHVPYPITWELERVEAMPEHGRARTLARIADVVPWFEAG